MAEEVNQPYTLVTAANGLGFLYLRRGDVDQAIAVLERHLQLCRVAHVPILLPQVAALLGYAYALCGRSAEGLALLEEAVDRAASMNTISFQPLWTAWLSEAQHLAGRSDDAVKLAERARELSHDRGERGHQAWALRLRGEVASCQDPPDVEQAEASYRQALALAGELRMRPLQAHCRLGLGKLYRRIGSTEDARRELGTAVEMLRAMGMAFWLPGAEDELMQMG